MKKRSKKLNLKHHCFVDVWQNKDESLGFKFKKKQIQAVFENTLGPFTKRELSIIEAGYMCGYGVCFFERAKKD